MYQKLKLPLLSEAFLLSKTSTVVIFHRCLVTFNIGNFQDTVQCDVVGMAA